MYGIVSPSIFNEHKVTGSFSIKLLFRLPVKRLVGVVSYISYFCLYLLNYIMPISMI